MLTVDCILKQYPCFGGPRKLPHNLLLKRVKQKFAILEFSSVSLRVCIILSWIVLMARSKIVAIDIRILSLSALVALGTRPPDFDDIDILSMNGKELYKSKALTICNECTKTLRIVCHKFAKKGNYKVGTMWKVNFTVNDLVKHVHKTGLTTSIS